MSDSTNHATQDPARREQNTEDARHMPMTKPVLTWGLLALLGVIFLGECAVDLAKGVFTFSPDLATLVAFGGLFQPKIVENGQWFRLLTAAFLHANLLHIAFNAYAFYQAGALLEQMIGRLWLAVLLLVGAVGGSLMSLKLNPPELVGVGASGAIIALFAFLLVIAFRYPKGPFRSALISNGLVVLALSLLPVAGALVDGKIDIAAHAGGALAGAALGVLMYPLWPLERFQPGGKALAALVVAAGVAVIGWGVVVLAEELPEYQFVNALIPQPELPTTDREALAQAENYIAKYPKDPRGYFFRGLARARQNDTPGAITDLSSASTTMARFPNIFPAASRANVDATLALVLAQAGRQEDAITRSRWICGHADLAEPLKRLTANGLCPAK